MSWRDRIPKSFHVYAAPPDVDSTSSLLGQNLASTDPGLNAEGTHKSLILAGLTEIFDQWKRGIICCSRDGPQRKRWRLYDTDPAPSKPVIQTGKEISRSHCCFDRSAQLRFTMDFLSASKKVKLFSSQYLFRCSGRMSVCQKKNNLQGKRYFKP